MSAHRPLSPGLTARGRGRALCPLTLPVWQLPAVALAAGLFASPCGAWEAERLTVHHDPGTGDAWFARVVIYNGEMSDTETHVLDTSHGPVSIGYQSALNYRAGCCSDTVRVTDLPPGVIPSEWQIEINETDTREIFLFEYLGG